MLHGTFEPSAEAKSLSSAPHFSQPSTSITVRFSSSTGIPQIPDNDANGQPRGLGIRFNLGDHAHTDIIGQSTPFFPTRTGAEFLEFLQALAAPPPSTGSPSAVESFLGSHPAALAFVQAPKPIPTSLVKEQYFGVNAFKLVNSEGKNTNFRYRIVPDAGEESIEEAALKEKGPNFLYEELSQRVAEGAVSFRLLAQIANEEDEVDDATIHWPESRALVELGTLKLEGIILDDAKEQKKIIFDPIPRLQGVEPSNDPLLEMRAAVYLISGRQRRAA